jgi:predicted anti-sigma-YlaC factor YlaD
MNLVYSCKKVAELLSQAQDEPLDILDQFRLKVHLSMCSSCQNVEQQLSQIAALMRSPPTTDD